MTDDTESPDKGNPIDELIEDARSDAAQPAQTGSDAINAKPDGHTTDAAADAGPSEAGSILRRDVSSHGNGSETEAESSVTDAPLTVSQMEAVPATDRKPKAKKKARLNRAETDAANRERFADSAKLIREAIDASTEERIKAGQELRKVKDALEHGQFLRWLKSEFPFTPRTAENYMQVAYIVGDNAKRVSYLGFSLLLKLSSHTTSDAIRGQYGASLLAGTPLPAAQVKRLISEERKAKSWAKQVALADIQTDMHLARMADLEQRRIWVRQDVDATARILAELPPHQQLELSDFFLQADQSSMRLLGEVVREQGILASTGLPAPDPSDIFIDRDWAVPPNDSPEVVGDDAPGYRDREIVPTRLGNLS